MVPNQRAEALLFGMKRTRAEEVTLHLTHVIEVLGVDKTKLLMLSKPIKLQEDRRVRRGKGIRTSFTGMGVFNREQVIDAIECSGHIDEGTASVVPAFRFAAGRLRSSPDLVRDAWRQSR